MRYRFRDNILMRAVLATTKVTTSTQKEGTGGGNSSESIGSEGRKREESVGISRDGIPTFRREEGGG